MGRLGSLQAAAEELGVSVGAVSQQVIKAEAQLDRVDFRAHAEGMVATEAGAGCWPRLTEGFTPLSAGGGDDAATATTRILTISVAPVFAARWLVYRLDRFAERHPEISLRMDATTRLVNPALCDVDIGIRVGSGAVAGCEGGIAAGAGGLSGLRASDGAQRLQEPADILALPAIIDGRAMFTWEVWMREAGLSGATLETRHVFNDASLCLDAAIAGQGVMLAWQTLAGYCAAARSAGRAVRHPRQDRLRPLFHHGRRSREPKKVRDFKAWIREEMAGNPAALA